MLKFLSLSITLSALLPLFGENAEPEVPLDPLTGMKMVGDWELVRASCIACHSPQLFLRQKGTLTTWTEIIYWMQRDGGLPPLTAEVETKILTYLTQNYGPGDSYRRSPIQATLMPANPYLSETKKAASQSAPKADASATKR